MKERPNFLLITTDQQRFDTIRSHGNGAIRTPHLDDMTRRGIRFSAAEADCPICIPSRATIMNGRHAITDDRAYYDGNTPIPVDPHKSLPGLLGRAGYQTQAVGKMHFWPLRARYGFDNMVLPHDYDRARARYRVGPPSLKHGLGQNETYPGLATVPQDETITAWTVDESIDFLETRDEDSPFFCWTSFTKPHPPFDPPEPYASMYRDVEMPERVKGDWVEEYPLKAGHIYDDRSHPRDAYDEQLIADMRRAYYGLITEVDYQLGRLFGRMRELDLLKNTWILFTTDHGELLGDHGGFGKANGLSPSARIPFILLPPYGTPDSWRGSVCEVPTSLADILPTFLKLADVEAPTDIDGHELLEWVDHPQERFLDGAMGRDVGQQHWITDGRFRYIYNVPGGSELLFDEKEDPLDTLNLASRPEHKGTLEKLKNELLKRREGHPVVADGAFISYASAPHGGEERAENLGLHTWKHVQDVLH